MRSATSALSLRGVARAALLSCGPHAVLSHLWAAALWGLTQTPPNDVDITVLRGSCGPRSGIALHRARSVDKCDVADQNGLRVSAVDRLLLDVAESVTARDLERLVSEAIGQRLTSPERLRAAAWRGRGLHGSAPLLALLARDHTARTRQEFERRLLTLIRAARLPQPAANAKLGPWEIDFLWAPQRFAVEADSRAWHSTRNQQRRDRDKDRWLGERGIAVRRVRWWELEDEPLALTAELARTLGERSEIG